VPERTPHWSPGTSSTSPAWGSPSSLQTALLLAVVVALAYRPDDATFGTATVLVLAALIGAYAVNVTTGLPWLSDGPEPVDLVGLATKSVEGIGLLFALQLPPVRDSQRSRDCCDHSTGIRTPWQQRSGFP
jgi:hypothetical protein